MKVVGVILALSIPLLSDAFSVGRPAVGVVVSLSRRAPGMTSGETTMTALHQVPFHHMFDTAASAVSQNAIASSIMVSLGTAPPETAGISYSKASYYTVLGLYLMSFPGIWSTIKRSTSAKVKRKTYVSAGEKSGDDTAMTLRQQAGEIMACK